MMMFCHRLNPGDEEEDACAMCAIVIAPDYACTRPGKGDETLRAQFHQYLIDSGVLPTPLPVGQEHVSDLKKALSNAGVHVSLLTDDATKIEVVRTVKCHAKRCQTLLIYFCGHGSPLHVAPSGTLHGTLDLVGTDQLLPDYVLEPLKSVGFRGKLVYVINSCSAGKLSTSPADAPIIQSQLSSPTQHATDYDIISIQSTSWGRGQTQSKGERFGRKFIELVQTDPPIKQWKRHLDAAETTFSPLLQDLKLFSF